MLVLAGTVALPASPVSSVVEGATTLAPCGGIWMVEPA